jgi:hypothetical protein
LNDVLHGHESQIHRGAAADWYASAGGADGKHEDDSAQTSPARLVMLKYADNDGGDTERQARAGLTDSGVRIERQNTRYFFPHWSDRIVDRARLMAELQRFCDEVARDAKGRIALFTDAPSWLAFMFGRAFPCERFQHVCIGQEMARPSKPAHVEYVLSSAEEMPDSARECVS